MYGTKSPITFKTHNPIFFLELAFPGDKTNTELYHAVPALKFSFNCFSGKRRDNGTVLSASLLSIST